MPGKKEKLPLSVTHPELAKEADGWDPSLITFGSGYKLRWKCKESHIWEAVVGSRATNNRGCPICSNKTVQIGFNDLMTTHPDIAKEACGWDPTSVTAGSNKKYAFTCKESHVWETLLHHRTGERQSGCPYCSNKFVSPGYNDIATTHPELAKEADGWDPKKVIAGSGTQRSWKCKTNEKHIWKTAPSKRANGTGCPFCANKKILIGDNDLATTNPILSKELVSFDPKTITAGSAKRVQWVCNNNPLHIWSATVAARVGGGGCPFCSHRSVFIGESDLATTNPTLAEEALGWDPKKVREGSGKKLWWKCKADTKHTWKDSPNNRKNGRGCPFCSGHSVFIGQNDLLSTHPFLAKQAIGWDPEGYSRGSNEKLLWCCEINPKHIWEASINHRLKGIKGRGCPYCSNKKILIGDNDLATTHPGLASQAFGWDPRTVTYGTPGKRKWVCNSEISHIWEASVSNRASGSDCPTCAKFGYDQNSPGFLYFLEHGNWQMFQIGITNVPEIRIKKHSKIGWELIEIRGPMDGLLILNWETAILRMLKAKGADLSNAKIAGKFDGYSEAWSKSTFKVKSIKELMKLTEEFEEKNT